MSYLRNGTEYVTWDEHRVLNTIRALSGAGRTGNNSQIANATGISRTAVGELTAGLRARGYIRDISRGAAYHWRVTGKQARTE